MTATTAICCDGCMQVFVPATPDYGEVAARHVAVHEFGWQSVERVDDVEDYCPTCQGRGLAGES